MFEVSNVSLYIYMISQTHIWHTHSQQKNKNKIIHIPWVTDPWGPRQWATPQQNKHTHSQKKKKKNPFTGLWVTDPQQTWAEPKGPRPQNPKRKNREKGRRKGKEKKRKKNPLGDSDFRFRTEASERRGRESESLRDVPAARRRRRSSCRGSVCEGNVRAEWRLWEWATEYYIFLLLLNSFVFRTC